MSMLLKAIRYTANITLLLSPFMLSACNGGSSDDSAAVNPGNLVVTSAASANNADVVLGGTHQYVVALANSINLAEPVIVTVTSSNNQVATIQSNTCTTPGVSATQSCSFYVNGTGTGNATVTVSASNYQPIVESLNVLQQWGTFSSIVSGSDFGL